MAHSTASTDAHRSSRTARGLRPLRVLPGHLPDLRAVGQRGRLAARADRADRRGLERDAPMSDEMVTHFDRCLGCMACVTACPSGVRYDRLIERVRPQVERHHARSRPSRALRRLLFETLPHPKRLRALAPLMIAGAQARRRQAPRDGSGSWPRSRRRPACASCAVASCPSTPRPSASSAAGWALLLGCVQRVFYADVHRATIAYARGRGVRGVRARSCPSAAGRSRCTPARRRPRSRGPRRRSPRSTRSGELDHIVTNAAGCGSAMKEYGELLGTPDAAAVRRARVRRLRAARRRSSRGRPAGRCRCRSSTTTPATCPRPAGAQPAARDAAAIPGLELLENPVEPGGLLRLGRRLQPAPARGRRRPRRAQGPATCSTPAPRRSPPATRAARPSSTCHLRELGRPLPIYHPIELIWRSIAAASADRAAAGRWRQRGRHRG